MIIVSDTSPITNLIQIGKLDLLRLLYEKVIVPPAVFNELAFLENQKILLEKEDWIEMARLSNLSVMSELLLKVDIGEAEAIALALELKADYLLIDEQLGRGVAESYGLKITGILGILVKAKQNDLIPEVRKYMNELRDNAKFRIHPRLFDRILKMVGEL